MIPSKQPRDRLQAKGGRPRKKASNKEDPESAAPKRRGRQNKVNPVEEAIEISAEDVPPIPQATDCSLFIEEKDP